MYGMLYDNFALYGHHDFLVVLQGAHLKLNS